MRRACIALALVVALVVAPGASGQGNVIVDQDFASTLPGGGWTFGGAPTPSIAQVAGATPERALRLTALGSGNSFGWTLYTLPQPTAGGLDITFSQAQWGGQADGISFFLKDGADANDTAVGAAGAALGYARSGPTPGLSGALLGVGLDTWGGFTVINLSGCPADPGFTMSSLSVRGPQGATRLDGYCMLPSADDPATRLQVVSGPGLIQGTVAQPWLGGATPWTTRAAAAQRWRIVVDPQSVVDPMVTITRLSAGTSISYRVRQPTELRQAATFKFGFASATGGQTNNNEIWGLSISSVEPLAAVDITRASLPTGAVGTTYACEAITTASGVNPIAFAIASGSLPPGLTLNPSTGEVCGTPTRGGAYDVVIRATDSRGPTASSATRAYAIVVDDVAPPCVPVDLAAAAGRQSATLTWSEDPDPACPGVTAFEVEAEDGRSCTTTYPTATCAITGLAAGTPIRFRVRARNAAGTSGWSAYSEAITPTAPPAPAPDPAPRAPTVAIERAIAAGFSITATIRADAAGRVVVAGSAVIDARRARVCRAATTLRRADEAVLRCDLDPAARARLCRRSLRVRVTTSLTTVDGITATTSRTIRLHRRTCRANPVTG